MQKMPHQALQLPHAFHSDSPVPPFLLAQKQQNLILKLSAPSNIIKQKPDNFKLQVRGYKTAT